MRPLPFPIYACISNAVLLLKTTPDSGCINQSVVKDERAGNLSSHEVEDKERVGILERFQRGSVEMMRQWGNRIFVQRLKELELFNIQGRSPRVSSYMLGSFIKVFVHRRSDYKEGGVHPLAFSRPTLRKALTMEEQVALLCDGIAWPESDKDGQPLEEDANTENCWPLPSMSVRRASDVPFDGWFAKPVGSQAIT